jgi:hypothetical protein
MWLRGVYFMVDLWLGFELLFIFVVVCDFLIFFEQIQKMVIIEVLCCNYERL